MYVSFSTYPWAFDCPGGGERQMLAYKEALSAYGVTVNLFDQWNPEINQFDIFHFFSVMPCGIQLIDYLRGKGKKICVSPNLWITPETADLYPVADIANMLSLVDRIIVNSKAEVDGFHKVFNLPLDRFVVVRNGCSSQYFNKTRSDAREFRASFGITGKYLINVANIEPRKNQLEFIRAMMSQGIDWTLVIVGNIRDTAYAEECAKIGGNTVRFIGPLEYASSQMISAISGASVFVMPSLVETPSIAALEAFAMGLPVLITERGCTKEYFGEYASYVDPNNLENLMSKLLFLEKSDGAPLELRKNFEWTRVVSDLVYTYQSLTS